MKAATTSSIACHKCQQEKHSKAGKSGEPRLPRNWQRFQERVWCDRCWHATYKLRAVTVPVRMLTPDIWKALRGAWQQSRAVANASVLQLLKDDVTRGPNDEKMPPPPKTYLYPIGREAAPGLAPAAVCSITHAVQQRYNRQRWDVIWRGEASPPLYRNYPYPVRPDSYDLRQDSDDGGSFWVFSARVGSEWVDMRLARGPGHRRAMAVARMIMANEAKGVEAAVLLKRSQPGDHRSGGTARENGSRYRWEVMVKLVAWLPRLATETDLRGPLEVATAPDVFLRVMHGQWQEPRLIQADHVRSWVIGHTLALERIKQRPQGSRHKQEEYTRRAEKQRNRLTSFVQMTAAQLRRWAMQAKASEIRLDDSCREYLPSFCWDKLRRQVEQVCDDLGITYSLASGEMVEEMPGVAREE